MPSAPLEDDGVGAQGSPHVSQAILKMPPNREGGGGEEGDGEGGFPRPAARCERFCRPAAPGSGPINVFAQEAPMKLSKSNVKSLNSCASSRAGVKRSSNLSGYMGSGRLGSNHRAVGDAAAGSRQRDKATRRRMITGAAKALPTAFCSGDCVQPLCEHQ